MTTDGTRDSRFISSLFAGPHNSLVDVPGIRVGHAEKIGDGWRSGVTAILFPPEGVVAGVDVSGGAPCTRETDMLDPRNVVERIHAITFSGGSVFGLAAATGVVEWLADRGVGMPVGAHDGDVVPLVPGACLFDLGRGGRFRATPDAAMAVRACEAAADTPFALGPVGAGTGAVIGGLGGGIGTASAVTPAGFTVAALAVANASGSAVDPYTGELYGARFGLPGEFAGLRRPDSPTAVTPPPEYARLRRNTTLALVATDARLTQAQCAKVAGLTHDGMARAIRPVHTLFDGDVAFAVSLGTREPDPMGYHDLLGAAGDVFSRAVVSAVLAATGWPGVPSYRQAFPSAFAQ